MVFLTEIDVADFAKKKGVYLVHGKKCESKTFSVCLCNSGNHSEAGRALGWFENAPST